ncbi:phosphoribosylanthranilate isomerase [Flammeovirgaceae bacterium SG7u.111]|nr:phosphoribosylanthranilate isomerase [Flammeovirgaceae bacterium SG7u.132]WPO38080.1 phosphoribosylanthranilate isomerase [Flammeovirgaceae bacterium SG7u.111]
MKPVRKPRVKICCISSVEEAQLAIDAGASALGLVAHMPSGPGVIEDELIREIALFAPPPIATFLLTSRTDAKGIIDHQRVTGATTIQLVDELKTGSYAQIKKALPGINIVQVIHVMGEESIEEALKISKSVDAVLLDSGNPNLAVKELGGTGRVHNWEVSKKIREQLEIPMFLAGGLKPENVESAIEAVSPFGLDLCSGVRTSGKLDASKLNAFFEAVQR